LYIALFSFGPGPKRKQEDTERETVYFHASIDAKTGDFDGPERLTLSFY
jgi:hypothetical protein